MLNIIKQILENKDFCLLCTKDNEDKYNYRKNEFRCENCRMFLFELSQEAWNNLTKEKKCHQKNFN